MAERTCHCFIRHAVTEDERADVVSRLEYSRRIGDTQGILISMAQLGPCPCQLDPEDRDLLELQLQEQV